MVLVQERKKEIHRLIKLPYYYLVILLVTCKNERNIFEIEKKNPI